MERAIKYALERNKENKSFTLRLKKRFRKIRKVKKKLNIFLSGHFRYFSLPHSIFSKKLKIIIYKPHINFGHQLYDISFLINKNIKLKYFILILAEKSELPFFYELASRYDKRIIFLNLKKKYFSYKFFLKAYISRVYKYYEWIRNEIGPFYTTVFAYKYQDRRYFDKNISINFNLSERSQFENLIKKEKLNHGKKKIICFWIRNENFYDHLSTKNDNRFFKNIKKRTNLRKNYMRNYGLENYLDLIEKNQNKFFFIKVGFKDNEASKVSFENYYDFSNSKLYSSKLETLLVHNSYACISPESGAGHLATVLNKPLLWINQTNPYLNFPFRRNQIGLMQKTFLKENNKQLFLEDYLDINKEMNYVLQNPKLIDYYKNSSEDLLYAFDQLQKKIKNNFFATEEEKQIKSLLSNKINEYRKNNKLIKKWFSNNYLGEGVLLTKNLLR